MIGWSLVRRIHGIITEMNERISIDPGICQGQACIKGMKVLADENVPRVKPSFCDATEICQKNFARIFLQS